MTTTTAMLETGARAVIPDHHREEVETATTEARWECGGRTTCRVETHIP
jgi:hypothetical protein